jgi:hypothetical protein
MKYILILSFLASVASAGGGLSYRRILERQDFPCQVTIAGKEFSAVLQGQGSLRTNGLEPAVRAALKLEEAAIAAIVQGLNTPEDVRKMVAFDTAYIATDFVPVEKLNQDYSAMVPGKGQDFMMTGGYAYGMPIVLAGSPDRQEIQVRVDFNLGFNETGRAPIGKTSLTGVCRTERNIP